MRLDGRKPDELRSISIIPDYTTYAEGSVLIACGNTKVLCNVTVEEGVPRWMQSQGKAGGWITGEYAMLPRSTHTRTPRETSGLGGRTQEIRRLIGRSLRGAVNLELLGARTCIIDCDVIQADGGTRTAAITGGYVALMIALRRLIQVGQIPAEALQCSVAAISVGLVNGEALLDLCYAEDSHAEADANIVMNSLGQFIEVQITAEDRSFSRSQLNTLLDLASSGIQQLFSIQQSYLGQHTQM